MRILLQQIGSGLYLKPDGWTKRPDEALNFASAEMARSYSDSEGWFDTFVVLLPDPEVESSESKIVDLKQTPEWEAVMGQAGSR